MQVLLAELRQLRLWQRLMWTLSRSSSSSLEDKKSAVAQANATITNCKQVRLSNSTVACAVVLDASSACAVRPLPGVPVPSNCLLSSSHPTHTGLQLSQQQPAVRAESVHRRLCGGEGSQGLLRHLAEVCRSAARAITTAVLSHLLMEVRCQPALLVCHLSVALAQAQLDSSTAAAVVF